MTASQMQHDLCYQVSHKIMGEGIVRRMGSLYHFWDHDRQERGIINADDLSRITLLTRSSRVKFEANKHRNVTPVD